MLEALEAYFVQALRTELPAEVTVSGGPSVGPATLGAKLVEVSAERLVIPPPEGSDPIEGRQPAFLTQEHHWSADGEQDTFQLPEEATGEITEVESPPGHPLRRGDDFTVNGQKILFYRPPVAADVAVMAVLRGERARGYQERRPCRISLVLRAWAGEVGAMDTLLASTLTTGLAAAAELGNLSSPLAGAPSVHLRLLRPVVVLIGVSRRTERQEDTRLFCAEVALSVRGELDQVVALGAPQPEGIIEKVQGKLIKPPAQEGLKLKAQTFRAKPDRRR